MKIVLFYHSLVSDWNHGNAHFLRGVATELIKSGHEVKVFEQEDGWSYTNLLKERGKEAITEFKKTYPRLSASFYKDDGDFNKDLKDADLVIVHEWNSSKLVKEIGQRKEEFGYTLFFHDTHHRSVTAEKEMNNYDLSSYDGVLAFGDTIRNIYIKKGWTNHAWTWHEAADINLFKPPVEPISKKGDVVWIGNWGDEERTDELKEFLIDPVQKLGLKAKMYGVRYPKKALKLLEEAGIEYGGYVPSYKVPAVFAHYRMTVHVPRRPYTKALPGIPTIRPFEALACGIPLISAPWKDSENLFREGKDFKMVQNGAEMEKWMERIIAVEEVAEDLIKNGFETVQEKHTCRHRAKELIEIYESIK
ncbi:MAG: glycosyltransferase [Balneolaceae bacterium]